jgi:HK97 family phage portal protein
MNVLQRIDGYIFGNAGAGNLANGELKRNRAGASPAGMVNSSDMDFVAKLLGETGRGDVYPIHKLEGLPAVFAIVRVLATGLGAIPKDVLSTTDDRRPMTNLAAYDLIRHKPNFLVNDKAFWTAFWWNAYLGGGGFAQIERDAFMNPTNLRLWKWHQVGTTYDQYYQDLFYTTPLGIVEVEDMISLPMNSLDGVFGRTPLEVCGEAASEGLAAQAHGNAFYHNGAKIQGALTVPTRLSNMPGATGNTEEEKAKSGRDRLRSGFRTSANSGEVPILEEGIKFTPFDMKFGDIEFIKTRNFTFEQLCSIYGVPPALVANYKDAKYTNAEQMDLSYVKHTLTNPLTQLEEELKTKLVPRKYWNRVEVYGDMDYLLRGDIKTQTEYYEKMMDKRVLTANDILRDKKRPIFKSGDERWVGAGMMPEDTAKEYYGQDKNNNQNNGGGNSGTEGGNAGTEAGNN